MTKFFTNSLFVGAALLVLTACGGENLPESRTAQNDSTKYAAADKGPFVLALNSLEDGSEFTLQAAEVENKTFHIKQNFLEMPNKYYTWIFRGKIGLAMSYQQTNPGVGYAVALGADGKIQKVGEFKVMSRFTNYEFLNDSVLLTSVSGVVSSDGKRNDGATFEYWSIKPTGVALIQRKTIWTKDITGTDEQITFSSIVPDGEGGFYTAMVKSGFRVNDGTNGSSSIGEVYSPDSCWVAQMDADLKVKRIFASDKQSYAAGQYRAMMLRTVLGTEDGTVYAFSNAMHAKTKHKASALRINKGVNHFDPDYFFDIQTASGGYKFRRIWYAGEHRFLLELYNDINVNVMSPGHDFAVVDMKAKTFSRVAGLPPKAFIVSGAESGGVPCYYQGAIYLPISLNGENAQLYKIDPATAQSKAIATFVGAKELRSIGVLH